MNAKDRYEFFLKYPYRKYCLVLCMFNIDEIEDEYDHVDEIRNHYFDYFELRKPGRMIQYIDRTRSNFIFICSESMKNFGDYYKLFEWNPETRCHDILVGEWH